MQHGEDVDISHPVVLRQPRLRRGAHAHIDGHAIAKDRNAGATPQVAGDVAEIFASQQRLGSFTGRAMAGPVESVAANAKIPAPFVWHGVGGRRFVHEPVGASLNHRDQRDSRKFLAKCLNGRDVGRIVRRSQERELFHCRKKFVVDQLRRIVRASMNHLEPDRPDLRQALLGVAFARNRRDTLANCGWVIGAFAPRLADSFHTPFRQNGLRRHVQDPVLERSATDIWNQAFHC